MGTTEKISLPGSPLEVILCIKDDSISAENKSTIRKYCGGSLIVGRLLDSLQIILAGYSGSGKSSTINFLFDDPTLCQTNSIKSETRDPVMVQKRLVCSQARGPPVEGTLSLVDLPGNFDTDNRKEVCNLASIRKFIDSMFASRENVSIPELVSTGEKIRETVYPNLILFTLKATDNRLDGNSTNLRKALMLLKQIGNLVDTEHPNLIILITHVCSLGLHATYFNEDLNEKKTVIRKVVHEVLGIADVDIVPIENQPDRYQLEKTGNYYKLPNEELSHYNLYQAMIKRLEKNNDNTGQLFANWYFQSSCPEKQTPAEAIPTPIDVDYSDLAKAAAELHILEKGTEAVNPVHVMKFDYLGCGYDPTNEKLKLRITPKMEVKDVQNMKQVDIEGNKFMVPKNINVVTEIKAESKKNNSKFQRLTFLEKHEYQEHMKISYGIDSKLNLNMVTGSDSKWMNDFFDTRGIRKLSFCQELPVWTAKYILRENMFKESAFYKELTSLPRAFDSEEAAKKFLAFFAKWGTHLIHEEKLGGSFQLNCTIKQASARWDTVNKIETIVQDIFKELFDFSDQISLPHIYSQLHNLRALGVIQESFEIQGGDVPEHLEWDNLTLDDIQKWRQSVFAKPAELPKSIKLIPYYNLLKLDGDKESALFQSLFQATKRYMEEPGSSCFPKGTLVYLASGTTIPVELLSSCDASLKTLGMNSGMPFDSHIKLGNPINTKFCAYLDKKPTDFVNYLVLQFSNGMKLTVSPNHIIFQLHRENFVVGKQAKNFKIGDKTVFMGSSGEIEYPAVEEIFQRKLLGAYSPLTMSGTFFADGFLVSSYADIDSFDVADGAMFPLKLWYKLNLYRTNSSEQDQRLSLETTNQGIHPYAKLLIAIRKLFSSVSTK